MDVLLPGLAGCLKRLRNQKGSTQKDMANILGVTERHYQKIEYGYINVPSLTLLRLADYFDVTTDYLLGREDRHENCP